MATSREDTTMTELQDIFADTLPASIFLLGSAVCMLVCAAAALWPRSRTVREQTGRTKYRAGPTLVAAPPSTIRP
jgi:hypothetical protein